MQFPKMLRSRKLYTMSTHLTVCRRTILERTVRRAHTLKLPLDARLSFSYFALSYQNTSHLSIFTSLTGRSWAPVLTEPSWSTTSMPCTTCPKTVCFPFRCGVGPIPPSVAVIHSPTDAPAGVHIPSVMKNCDPFVPGPLFAIDSVPLSSCLKLGTISSSNLPP